MSRTHPIALGFLIIPLACSSFFRDNYTGVKWYALYGLTALALMHFLKKKDAIVVPQLHRSEKILLLLLGLTYFLSIALNWSGYYLPHVVDWICFAAVFLVSYACVQKSADQFISQILKLNLAATLIVMTHAALQYFGFDPLQNYLSTNEFPGSFFGYQNMTAEFIGISILLQIYQIYTSKKYALSAITVISFVYLYVLSCRSVFVAVAAGMLVLYFLNWSQTLRRLVLILGIGAVIVLGSKIISSSAELKHTKNTNLQIRLIRWQNTLQMIRKNPFGVGPGNFEFEYLRYHWAVTRDYESSEDVIAKSPHNGYLEAAAELGVLCALTLFILLFLTLKHSLRTISEQKRLGLSILIFILADAFFAFPMELAYPFFATAVFLAITLQGRSRSIKMPDKRVVVTAGVAAVLILIVGTIQMLSSYFDDNHRSDWLIEIRHDSFHVAIE